MHLDFIFMNYRKETQLDRWTATIRKKDWRNEVSKALQKRVRGGGGRLAGNLHAGRANVTPTAKIPDKWLREKVQTEAGQLLGRIKSLRGERGEGIRGGDPGGE